MEQNSVGTPTVSHCNDFFQHYQQWKTQTTIVIAPASLQTYVSGLTEISWTCSKGEHCSNPFCKYALLETR